MKRASKLKIAGKDRIEDICTEETLAACHCGETRLALDPARLDGASRKAYCCLWARAASCCIVYARHAGVVIG